MAGVWVSPILVIGMLQKVYWDPVRLVGVWVGCTAPLICGMDWGEATGGPVPLNPYHKYLKTVTVGVAGCMLHGHAMSIISAHLLSLLLGCLDNLVSHVVLLILHFDARTGCARLASRCHKRCSLARGCIAGK